MPYHKICGRCGRDFLDEYQDGDLCDDCIEELLLEMFQKDPIERWGGIHMSETKGLCPTCSNSIRCDTWAEYKCTVKKRRIYGYAQMTECKEYKKRPAGWKEMPCRCEDCLRNEMLSEEIEED